MKLRHELQEIIQKLREAPALIEEWASQEKPAPGTVVLLAGARGTGKTLAAEVLAKETGGELLRVDLDRVVGKYIGETEKNLRALFETAADRGAILFFDEADALFGKRSEVKDAHDRYANLEVSYLLQSLENYRGLAVIAVKDTGNLDEAFLRRLRFVIRFPPPENEE